MNINIYIYGWEFIIHNPSLFHLKPANVSISSSSYLGGIPFCAREGDR